MLLRLIMLFIVIHSYSNTRIDFDKKTPLEYSLQFEPKISSYIQTNIKIQYNAWQNEHSSTMSLYSKLSLDFKNYSLTADYNDINSMRMQDLYSSYSSYKNDMTKYPTYRNEKHPIYNNKTAYYLRFNPDTRSRYTNVVAKKNYTNMIKAYEKNVIDMYIAQQIKADKNKILSKNDPKLLMRAKSKIFNSITSFIEPSLSFGITLTKNLINQNNTIKSNDFEILLGIFAECEVLKSLLMPMIYQNDISPFNSINKSKDAKNLLIYKMKDMFKLGTSIEFDITAIGNLQYNLRIEAGLTPLGFFCDYDKIGFPYLHIHKINDNSNADGNYNKYDKKNKLSNSDIDIYDYTLFQQSNQKTLIRLRNIIFVNISLGLKFKHKI
ncbi:MAG: hypothetical protein AAFO15_00760 [Pseudomonadota bacterium]